MEHEVDLIEQHHACLEELENLAEFGSTALHFLELATECAGLGLRNIAC